MPEQKNNTSKSELETEPTRLKEFWMIVNDISLEEQLETVKKEIAPPCERLYVFPSGDIEFEQGAFDFTDVDTSVFHTESLKKLILSCVTGIIDLSPLTNLTDISVTYGDMNYGHLSPNFAPVTYKPRIIFPLSDRLEKVAIQGCAEFERNALVQLPNLKTLTIHFLEDNDLSWLNESPSLTNIYSCLTFPDSVVLPSIPTLERIEFHCLKPRWRHTMKSIDLSPLSISKNLKKICFRNQRISEVDFTPIAKCQNLQDINFSGCNLATIDLSCLESRNLHKISLFKNQLHRIIMPHSTHLECVDLGFNKLQHIDLRTLASPYLKTLYLQNNNLVDIDLSSLSDCNHLEFIELSENRLDTIDLTPLTNMKNLERINLAHNFINKIDVTPLLSCSSLKKAKFGRNTGMIADSQKSMNIQSPQLLKMKKRIEWY